MQILLKSINDVKNFVNIMSTCPTNATLQSGKYVVDAKSIMGIFSLDLSNPINLSFDEEMDNKFLYKIDCFIV